MRIALGSSGRSDITTFSLDSTVMIWAIIHTVIFGTTLVTVPVPQHEGTQCPVVEHEIVFLMCAMIGIAGCVGALHGPVHRKPSPRNLA
jgi:hypothetical protein